MTVREAIEILKTMPQEALLATHANNHTANDNIRIAEGFAWHYKRGRNAETVFIGNFDPERFSYGNERLKEPVVLHKSDQEAADFKFKL